MEVSPSSVVNAQTETELNLQDIAREAVNERYKMSPIKDESNMNGSGHLKNSSNTTTTTSSILPDHGLKEKTTNTTEETRISSSCPKL